jgi:hypothetical protein
VGVTQSTGDIMNAPFPADIYFRIDNCYSLQPLLTTPTREFATDTNKSRARTKLTPQRSAESSEHSFTFNVFDLYVTKPRQLLQELPSHFGLSSSPHNDTTIEDWSMSARHVQRRIGSHPENSVIRTTMEGGRACHTILGHAGWPETTWRGNLQSLEELQRDTRWAELILEEQVICRTFRLFPKQLLDYKATLIERSKDGPLRKRDIKKLFRLDVNKVSKLFDIGLLVGWIAPW